VQGAESFIAAFRQILIAKALYDVLFPITTRQS
jgi:hypothetical protein